MNHPCEDCRQSCDVPCWKVDHGLLVEPPRWIPVTERLPDIGIKVLVYDKWGHIRDRQLRAYGTGGYYFTPDGLTPGRHVTHWMLLPEPPKEDNDG